MLVHPFEMTAVVYYASASCIAKMTAAVSITNLLTSDTIYTKFRYLQDGNTVDSGFLGNLEVGAGDGIAVSSGSVAHSHCSHINATDSDGIAVALGSISNASGDGVAVTTGSVADSYCGLDRGDGGSGNGVAVA